MVRTEISLFLENVPGELGKLTSMLSAEGINEDIELAAKIFKD